MKENIPINNLHKDMRGLKIAQISDLHVGPTIKKGYVESVVNEVNELNPDIIAEPTKPFPITPIFFTFQPLLIHFYQKT